MPEENWKEFIQKKHSEYKKIGYVECPAFGNEKIYFNKHGFNHLTRKEGKPRPLYEQIRRLTLFPLALLLLKEAGTFHNHEVRTNEDSSAQFWTFIVLVELVQVKVIVRQRGNGRKHFFSIMDRL